MIDHPGGTEAGCGPGIEADLRAELLAPTRIEQTYPLARFSDPSLTLAHWRALCSDAPERSGAMLIVCGRGYVRALCRFTTEHSLAHGHVLQITDIATGHPLDPARFASLLMERTEEHARALGCSTVLVQVPAGVTWLGRVLRDRGHRESGTFFTKPLHSTPHM
ncbi:MAG: hypothetical protein ACK4QW_01565 [Alphaproteobacteria bacterium]